MNFCRPASELEGQKIFPDLFDKMSNEEVILSFRNGQVYSFLDDDDWTNEEKVNLLEIVDETRDMLIINGLIRPEINYGVTPEMRFVLEYVVKTDLTDRLDIFMPYCFSNEDYERYVFCFERIEAVLKILEKELNAMEFYEVLSNIMSDDAVCDEKTLNEAKRKMIKRKEKILPQLEKAFEIF